jgi:hypothetical protein
MISKAREAKIILRPSPSLGASLLSFCAKSQNLANPRPLSFCASLLSFRAIYLAAKSRFNRLLIAFNHSPKIASDFSAGIRVATQKTAVFCFAGFISRGDKAKKDYA